jgi:3-hydroxypropanoate dehydrogenase
LSNILSDHDLGILFRDARTHSTWQDKDVSPILLEAIYDLAKMGPTSVNCSPMRVVFLTSIEAKERLKPLLSPGNVDKTMAAPATAIIGFDMQFYELLPKLAPHMDARPMFEGKPAHIETSAFRNGTLQGAYFIVAARAVGLDCGPMSGFDNAKVDAEFFPDGRIRSNFLCNLGYGDASRLRPRAPRLDFDEACQII